MTKKTGLTRRDVLKLPAAAAALSAGSGFSLGQQPALSPLRDVPWPDSPNFEGRAFERVTFEMSPKPFRQMDEAYVRNVCGDLFRQWSALIRRVDAVAVMLWTADGSEILDYRGRMSDEVEWARYIGIANRPEKAPGDDPERRGLHSVPHLYMDNPPKMTYGTLAMIVRTLKQVGREVTGKPIYVGATFDPGPEFANSKFKYVRHPEIANDNTMGRGTFVTCVTRLHADNVAYAAFPKGTTEGMSLGTFLGGQSQHFLSDMGFDYLWLSNGFGFAVSPWAVKGPLFDGTQFDVAKAPELRDAIIGFWKDFRKEGPKIPLETRHKPALGLRPRHQSLPTAGDLRRRLQHDRTAELPLGCHRRRLRTRTRRLSLAHRRAACQRTLPFSLLHARSLVAQQPMVRSLWPRAA